MPQAAAMRDPASLTAMQWRALGAGMARELVWGLRLVRAEHRAWTVRAAAIPDQRIRAHALAALEAKQPLLHGVALFWTLLDRREPQLIRLLVAFQILANYHDNAGERAGAGIEVGAPGSSMTTIVEAVDLDREPSSYAPGPHHPDGGYLLALANTCRRGCRELRSYDTVRELLVRETLRARSQDLEHDGDAARRPVLMQEFACVEHPDTRLEWFECVAASTSMLTVIVVLALATEPDRTLDDATAAVDAYLVVGLLSALLDNYVDEAEDRLTGSHNFLAYYGSSRAALDNLTGVITRALRGAGALHNPERHLVIVCSMLAMYLTTDGARAHDPQEVRRLVHAGGSLTRLLVPVLAAWRLGVRQRGA